MLLAFLVVVGVGLALTVGRVVHREVRLLRAAKQDRPAMLEGGGSHLTVRKGS